MDTIQLPKPLVINLSYILESGFIDRFKISTFEDGNSFIGIHVQGSKDIKLCPSILTYKARNDATVIRDNIRASSRNNRLDQRSDSKNGTDTISNIDRLISSNIDRNDAPQCDELVRLVAGGKKSAGIDR